MSIYTTKLTSNDIFYLCDVVKARGLPFWEASVTASGTFGGGTVSYLRSLDNGITYIPQKDFNGTPITSAGADDFVLHEPNGGTQMTPLRLYAQLAGSTGSPEVTITLLTNS